VREPLSAAVFSRLQVLRRMSELGSGKSVMQELVSLLRREASALRFRKIPLFFDSVSRHIAQDSIAQTIEGYLVARKDDGGLVKRPALRGVAYRMLKEFGNGNVELALRDGWGELRYALARHLQGGIDGGLVKLASATISD
jgi:hypothetical protein